MKQRQTRGIEEFSLADLHRGNLTACFHYIVATVTVNRLNSPP
ncbi:MAG: hypothetical protein OES26_19845 [Gammaproteobacteria bacterium]|nr:hypothetical protein [Gammaproteobacteria bacterium]